ncbi:hypothetical protein Hanom_Chr04g00301441 [Helianthus anomalus]
MGFCSWTLFFTSDLLRSGILSGICVVIGRNSKLRVWYLLCCFLDLTSTLVSETIEVLGQTNLKCTW